MKTFAYYHIELPAGASGEQRVTCPKCSPTRKKKHQRCLAVNVDKGSWFCHHCGDGGGLAGGWSGAIEPHRRKPEYVRPVAMPIPDTMDAAMVKWFEQRPPADRLNCPDEPSTIG